MGGPSLPRRVLSVGAAAAGAHLAGQLREGRLALPSDVDDGHPGPGPAPSAPEDHVDGAEDRQHVVLVGFGLWTLDSTATVSRRVL